MSEIMEATSAYGVTVPDDGGARRASLLELLHPLGVARRALLLGSNCPPVLRPVPCLRCAAQADLVVLAPTPEECQTTGWLAETAQAAAAALAPDGLVYVVGTPRWRASIARLLQRQGLCVEPAFLHYPDWASSRILIPLDWRAMGYAFSHLIPTRPWRRHMALSTLHLPGATRVLAAVSPAAGLIARRPGARPLFDWMNEASDQTAQRAEVIINTSWRGSAGAVILHRFAERRATPSFVAKLSLSAGRSDPYGAEAANLETLGTTAANAGAQVPRLLRPRQPGLRPVLLETALTGRSAASFLAERPEQLPHILARVVTWLEQWNRLTRTRRIMGRTELAEALLQPAEVLASELDGGEHYLAWLQAQCHQALGRPVACVATHNDLTMVNVLVDDMGRLGVLDWETARGAGLPLVDFFYAAVDAVDATTRYADRLAAFQACFSDGGAWVDHMAGLRARLGQALDLPAGLIDLCFHACWLHHAFNEKMVTSTAMTRPFLQILQTVVLHAIAGEGVYAVI